MKRPYSMSVLLPQDRRKRYDSLSRRPWIELYGAHDRTPILVELATSPEGTLVCTGLVVGAFTQEEITARDLREIRLGEILTDLGIAVTNQKKSKAIRNPEELRRITIGDQLEDAVSWVVKPTKLRPGPHGHPREHFEGVATAYRAALVWSPGRPIKTLAEQYHASEATVRRWVQRARDMGLLGESVPGKAGETKPRTRRGRLK
jgi:hypothetical protein